MPHPLRLLLPTGALFAGALAVLQDPRPDEEDAPLAVGDTAPAFVLNDQAGALVSVGGESEEWVVLAFYPKALTGG